MSLQSGKNSAACMYIAEQKWVWYFSSSSSFSNAFGAVVFVRYM